MRMLFANAKMCEEALEEALESLRATLRAPQIAAIRPNPFARAMPLRVRDPLRTGKVLRVF
jgi:hypothetical protein